MPSTSKILPERSSSLVTPLSSVLSLASRSPSLHYHIAISQNNNVTALLAYRTMEHRDYNYYEANAATINLRQITSSAKNAKIVQRLRDGDDNLHHLYLGRETWNSFTIGEGDNLGWLGYFIGKSLCLQRLYICYLPDGEQQIHAIVEGIARSQSLRNIGINNLNNDAFTSIVRSLHSLSQLEALSIERSNNVGPDDWSELETLLESGVCKLKELFLCRNNYIGNEGMDVLSNGLRGIGSSLKVLDLSHNSIGNEGLSAVVQAMQSCTGIERLDLSSNDFSSAAAGLSSLSDWLQTAPMSLKNLCLENCRISDVGYMRWQRGQRIIVKYSTLTEMIQSQVQG